MARTAFTTRINVLAAAVPTTPLKFVVTSAFIGRGSTLSLAGYVSGGTPPYSNYAVASGALPSGVSLNATTGVLTATTGATLGDKTGIAFRVTDAASTTVTAAAATLNVYDPFAAVPAKGLAKMVSPSYAHYNATPTGKTDKTFNSALFESYGTGTFNRYYSANGAYILALSGGHSHQEYYGAAIFDYSTMQWSYKACTNPGVVDALGYLPASMLTPLDDPWGEVAAWPGVPSAPHPMAHQFVIPPDKGGSAKGSMIYVGRGASTPSGNKHHGSAHSFDLITGLWKRQSVPGSLGFATTDPAGIYDPVKHHYYVVTTKFHEYKYLRYLDGNDWTFKNSPSYSGWPPAQAGSMGGWYHESNGHRCLMIARSSMLCGIDLDAIGAGWKRLTTTGATMISDHAHPVQHVADNIVYRRYSATESQPPQGQRLERLTPPSGHPLEGTWNVDYVNLGGDAISDYCRQTDMFSGYRALMYIPQLEMLGWVTQTGVFLLNP